VNVLHVGDGYFDPTEQGRLHPAIRESYDAVQPGRKPIDDAYDNVTVGAKLGAQLTETADIGLVARYIGTSLDLTGTDFSVFPGVPAVAHPTPSTPTKPPISASTFVVFMLAVLLCWLMRCVPARSGRAQSF